MRVLKPEIDKMTKDIPADNQAERQQATWSIYSKAGSTRWGLSADAVADALLIAMFTFFPTSIELRGAEFPLGAGPLLLRCGGIMECQYTIHLFHIRQPYQFVLYAYDNHQHYLYQD